MRWFFLAMLLVVSSSLVYAQATTDVTFTEAKNLDSGSYRGYAQLNVDKPEIKLGSKYTIDIRFFNTGGGENFYNPFFTGLIPLPAQLAIYDSKKKYLGDRLYMSEIISRRLASANDWIFVASNSYVGTLLGPFTAGYLNGTQKLPAGEYYLQMIYYRAYLAPKPAPDAGKDEQPMNFYENFDRTELFRSNAIKIRFTD